MELDGQFIKTIQTPSNTSSFTTDVTVVGTLEKFREHVLTITKLVEPVQGEVALLGLTLPPEGRSAAPFRFIVIHEQHVASALVADHGKGPQRKRCEHGGRAGF